MLSFLHQGMNDFDDDDDDDDSSSSSPLVVLVEGLRWTPLTMARFELPLSNENSSNANTPPTTSNLPV